MFTWINGVTREYRVRNEYVRGNIGMALIGVKMRENRPRWFPYVMRREKAVALRAVMEINIEEKKDWKRVGLIWLWVI